MLALKYFFIEYLPTYLQVTLNVIFNLIGQAVLDIQLFLQNRYFRKVNNGNVNSKIDTFHLGLQYFFIDIKMLNGVLPLKLMFDFKVHVLFLVFSSTFFQMFKTR